MRTKEGLTLRKVGSQYMIAANCEGCDNQTNVYTLNKTAAYLWEKVAGRDFEEETLVGLLCEKYEIDEYTASQDVKSLIESWKQTGLIVFY